MADVKVKSLSLGPADAFVRLSSLQVTAALPANVRIRSLEVEAAPVVVHDNGQWLFVDGEWRPYELWIDVP